MKDWGYEYTLVYTKKTRSPSKQAGMQVAALFITLGISVVSGVITGLILNTKCMFPIKNYFDDREYWDIEEEEVFDEKKKMIAKPNNGTRRETELQLMEVKKENNQQQQAMKKVLLNSRYVIALIL